MNTLNKFLVCFLILGISGVLESSARAENTYVVQTVKIKRRRPRRAKSALTNSDKFFKTIGNGNGVAPAPAERPLREVTEDGVVVTPFKNQ